MRFSREYRQIGFIGDEAEDLKLCLWTSAGFAGCKESQKSTNGVFLALCGPNTFCSLTGCSNKQGCVSKSTPESEIVAMVHGLRIVGLHTFTTASRRLHE